MQDVSKSPVLCVDGSPYDNRDTSSLTNQVATVILKNVPIVSLLIDGVERLCLAQISNTLLREFTYNEIHNRRVALGITCIQCTPVQLEILRRAGAMPVSSRRCGMITKREAQRLVKSFLDEPEPPQLPENFSFEVYHECGWGCHGKFVPSRYNSSRAKCIKCVFCSIFFSPNKFIFHCHKLPTSVYHHPDAANFNSWRRHLKLVNTTPDEDLIYAWEDVKAMFNGGSRRKVKESSSDESELKIPKAMETAPYSNQTYQSPFSSTSLVTPNPYDLFRHFPMRPLPVPVPPLQDTDWSKYTDLLRMRAMVGQYTNFWSKPYQPEICYPKHEILNTSNNTHKTESSRHQIWRGFLDDEDERNTSKKVVEIVEIETEKLKEEQKTERGSRKSKPRKCDLSTVEGKRCKFSDEEDLDIGDQHELN